LTAGLGCTEAAHHLDLIIVEAREMERFRCGAANLEPESFVSGDRSVIVGGYCEGDLPEAGHGFSTPHCVSHQGPSDSLTSCRWLHVHTSDEAAVALFDAGFPTDADNSDKDVVDECTEYMSSRHFSQ